MLIKYSALVLTVALSAPSIAASSSNENDLGFEGYLLALGTMAPNRAKFTVMHKDFVENLSLLLHLLIQLDSKALLQR